MTIQLEIPEEFVPHFLHDRFEDSLDRLSADAHMIAGNYEKETATMLIEAFKKCKVIDHHREEVEIVYRYEVMNGIYENDRMTRFYDAGNCPVQKPWYKENDPSVMGRSEGERHIPISEKTISARAAEILQEVPRKQFDAQWQSYIEQRKRSFDRLITAYVDALEDKARKDMLKNDSPWGSWLGRISNPQKPGNYIDLDITGYSINNTVYLTAQIVQNNTVRDEVVISQLPYDNFISEPTCFADKINDIDKIMEYPNLILYNSDGLKGNHSLEEHYQLLRQNGFESVTPDRTMYEEMGFGLDEMVSVHDNTIIRANVRDLNNNKETVDDEQEQIISFRRRGR